jgi:hypothetical protein
MLTEQRTYTPAQIEAYWLANADRWREIRRLGQCEPATRMPYLPPMSEGSELHEAQAREGAT